MDMESTTMERALQELPGHLTISTFSAARGKEIEIMRKALSASSGIKLAFQKLPKHMRRRAMSHNVKRLPRRLREIHMNQMKKSGTPPKQKRPSRKYRRRPSNLASECVRRQRRVMWLNTHIWHAKRFHMVEKWGYRLPLCPCDRAFRACYRATMKHCLLQDISYHSCIELKGSLEVLINGLARITDSSTGLGFQAKSYISGSREGHITIFRFDNKNAIGKVSFIWRPIENDSKRSLWIWIHAGFYKEVLDSLVHCFDLKHSGLEDRIISYSNENTEVVLLELKHELNRFRLTGPLSNAILQNCFKFADIETTSKDSWLSNYFQHKNDHYIAVREYWEKLISLSSASEISPYLIIPIVIEDPRFHLPKHRTKSRPLTETSSVPDKFNEEYLHSPLWDKNVRRIVADSKISQAELAKLRSNLLVPGTDLEEKPAVLPVILLQRPGRRQQYMGYGAGWDIILPSAWAQPLWLSLIMWGGRPGGLRETNSVDFESDHQCFLYPDTQAGCVEEQDVSLKAREQFFRLPPNKRTNYNKFAVSSPFCWNWQLLAKEWSCSDEHTKFFVLRDRKLLFNLQKILKTKSDLPKITIPENCLVPVSVHYLGKGPCKKFALICLPQRNDLKIAPSEPHCKDPNEATRQTLRKNHKLLLKRLRRRRVRAKRKGKVIRVDTDMLKNYTQKMRELWLPETTKIRHSCSREVMGFVKHGDFSFLLARAKGVGYITGGALNLLLMQTEKNKVLVRNTNSRQYRLGTLHVICE